MTFDESLEYVKRNKRVDGHKFNKATDITNLIDFHNQQIKDKEEVKAQEEVREISKFLARIMGRTMIFMK